MPFFKVTMEFNCFRGGWSESLYFENTDQGSVQARMNMLRNRRLDCSPPTVILVGFRIAEWLTPPAFQPTPRLSQFYLQNLSGTMLIPQQDNAQDTLALKVQMLARTANRTRRFVDIGGLMDSETNFSNLTGAGFMGPVLSAAVQAYNLLLVSTGCQVWANLRPTDPGYPWATVVSVQANGVASPTMTLNTAAVHGLVVGDYATFGRVNLKIFPGLKGNWPVLAKTDNSLTIGYYNNFPTTPFAGVAGLRVRKLGKQYNQINQMSFNGLRAHKYGRPFAESVGKQKAVSFRR